MKFDEEGHLTDSAYYVQGFRKGIGYRWHADGYLSDSLNFDGSGNGTQVSWNKEGVLVAARYWMQDTRKRGCWKYYYGAGKLKATEDFDEKGRLKVCNCYTVEGVALDTALCREKEACTDSRRWVQYLSNSLQSFVDKKSRQGIRGNFTALVCFVVEKGGSISDVEALTAYGNGIGESVERIIAKAPRWTPGQVMGRAVRSYHTAAHYLPDQLGRKRVRAGSQMRKSNPPIRAEPCSSLRAGVSQRNGKMAMSSRQRRNFPRIGKDRIAFLARLFLQAVRQVWEHCCFGLAKHVLFRPWFSSQSKLNL